MQVMKEKKYEEKSQKDDKSPCFWDAPAGWILTKFGMDVDHADLLTCTKFDASLLRGLDFGGRGQSLLLAMASNTAHTTLQPMPYCR